MTGFLSARQRERARYEGWIGIFVLGDPKYYERFRFNVERALGFSTPYAGSHLCGDESGKMERFKSSRSAQRFGRAKCATPGPLPCKKKEPRLPITRLL
jgi:hypothetical protein